MLASPYLEECLILEVYINSKKGYMISLFWSPSETPKEFDSYINGCKKLVVDISSRNSHFTLIAGDFNANSTNWFVNDTTTSKGAQLNSLVTMCGLKQLITGKTHILEKSSRCIDVIFINQPNIVIDSEIHTALHSKWYHQIVYSKLK